jgi:hypothetical protein
MDTKLTILKNQLANLDTRSALLCICQKGAEAKCFFWSDQMWTASQALDVWEDYLLEVKCSEFGVVRFYGGPPKQGKWYNGTMLSMLCDLFLLIDEMGSTIEIP